MTLCWPVRWEVMAGRRYAGGTLFFLRVIISAWESAQPDEDDDEMER